MKIIAIILLWVGIAGAAQTFTIPEGVNTYGPFALNVLHRRSDITAVATTNNFTLLTLAFEYSTDKGNTWIWYGASVHPGGQPTPTLLGSFKKLPDGVAATHVRVIATVTGGAITIAAAPSVRTR